MHLIPPKPVRACLFDMDGLLLDTEIVYTRVTQDIVSRYGHVYDWSIKANMIGRPAIESARYLCDTLGLPISPEEYLESRNAKLIEGFQSCKPLPGARELILQLHAQDVPIAVATSSDRELFDVKTQNHRSWFSLFDAVVTPDHPDVQSGKPAPDIFLTAASELNTAPADCLVFEDAPSGLEAAIAAGMQSVVVPDENMDKARYSSATTVLDSLADFLPEDFNLPSFKRAPPQD